MYYNSEIGYIDLLKDALSNGEKNNKKWKCYFNFWLFD